MSSVSSTNSSSGSATPASSASSLAISGLSSGFNWQAMITQLANAERSPETGWLATQSTINQRNAAFTTVSGYLNSLQSDIQALAAPTLYSNAAAQSSNTAVATATAAQGSAVGSNTFTITQLATNAQYNGTANIGTPLAPPPMGDPNSVVMGSAGFATPATAGTFTVNGAQVTLQLTDTLQQVFNNIATATNNAVTASYDPNTDKITLTSANASQPIVLGSGSDTSNFLQVAQLNNNGSGTVTSNYTLGRATTTGDMTKAHLATTITDGGNGQGQLQVNGVTISYNASNDNIQDVLDRITNSTAGVTASYDSINNRFVMTNKNTGDTGISVQDVTGNFAAATGLTNGSLVRGKNLEYTLNNGSQTLISQSNVITSASSSIQGVSVTALSLGTATVTVNTDASGIVSALQQFVSDYNTTQSYISSQQANSTDANGKTVPGLLTGDLTASGIANTLRSLTFQVSQVAGLPAGMNQLADLGILTNGKNNTISINSTTLSNALGNNLNSIQSMFTDTTSGLGTLLNNYLNHTIGVDGTLTKHQASLTTQSTSITAQVANQEKIIASDTAKWTAEFQAMEVASAQTKQEATYLSQQVNSGAL